MIEQIRCAAARDRSLSIDARRLAWKAGLSELGRVQYDAVQDVRLADGEPVHADGVHDSLHDDQACHDDRRSAGVQAHDLAAPLQGHGGKLRVLPIELRARHVRLMHLRRIVHAHLVAHRDHRGSRTRDRHQTLRRHAGLPGFPEMLGKLLRHPFARSFKLGGCA